MRRKQSEYDQIEVPGGGGVLPKGSSGSSSLRGSGWAKGPRPTEEPLSKMELRTKQRLASPPVLDDAAKEAARRIRKQKLGMNFLKGGMVKGGKSVSCKSHVDWDK